MLNSDSYNILHRKFIFFYLIGENSYVVVELFGTCFKMIRNKSDCTK